MEACCRISLYFRGCDPRFVSGFPLHSYFTHHNIVSKGSKGYPGSGCKRFERHKRFFCCSQLFPVKAPLLADCFSQQVGDGEFHSAEPCLVTGGVVALGKFDALHVGHRELVIQASKVGMPYLLSFVGMAEVLGWEQRAPIVAKCDRERVLSLWAPYCGNIVPVEYQIEFASVRHLTPRQFVERLSRELGVSGVVAGENYRFGYKASGDASELVKLSKEYGLGAYIVSSVMDRNQTLTTNSFNTSNSRERGQVSSTRVRHALAIGDMEYVSQLLGRPHRLLLAMTPEFIVAGKRISAPKFSLLNQPPKDGLYESCLVVADNVIVGHCVVTIDVVHVHLELDDGSPYMASLMHDAQIVGIEFC